MTWWKRFTNRFKKYEKWIEIKIPKYLQNQDNDPFKKDNEEILDDEGSVLQELRKEEE
ncbi:hypothetical protein KY343_00280 [Candidatus Woesearchaeota archaeon]|nr:hypothetical protein [Candidatus Woesearchaeota archaeon]